MYADWPRRCLAVVGSPSSRTVPLSCAMSPATMSSKVLFPDPEGPTNATNSALPTVRLSPPRAMSCRPSSSKVEMMFSSSRRGIRAGVIVGPPSISDGFESEVVGDDRGNLVPEAHAVVRATVLGINLSRVGQVESGQSGAMIRNPLAVVEGNDRLGRSLAKDPGSFDPGTAELWIDPLQKRNVRVDQLVVRHRKIRMVRLQVLRKVDEPFPAVLLRGDEIGVLDDPRKWKIVVRDIEPVDVGEGLTQLKQRHDCRLILQPTELLSILLRERGNQPRQHRRWRRDDNGVDGDLPAVEDDIPATVSWSQ